MLEYAIYSVISPEGCAAILWKDQDRKADAAEAMKLTAPDLLELGRGRRVIPEPPGGAHTDPGRRPAGGWATPSRRRSTSSRRLPADELLEPALRDASGASAPSARSDGCRPLAVPRRAPPGSQRREPMPPAAAAAARWRRPGCPAGSPPLLARRGVADRAERRPLPPTRRRPAPRSLSRWPAWREAVERLLAAARERGERVAIVGRLRRRRRHRDGAAARRVPRLRPRRRGAILPHRLREGYGFQPVHVERAGAARLRADRHRRLRRTSSAAVEAARGARHRRHRSPTTTCRRARCRRARS